MNRPLIFATLLLLFTACNNQKFKVPQPDNQDPLLINTTIQDLEKYINQGIIKENIVIGGTVTSDDSAGNFYKQLFIQDQTGAVEIRTGIYDSYTLFRRGRTVTVDLNGLAIGQYESIVQIGNFAQGKIDYLTSVEIIRQHIHYTEVGVELEVQTIPISAINATMIGKVVRLEGAFHAGGIKSFSGLSGFYDNSGRSINIYSSSYALFANDILPVGQCQVSGIIILSKKQVQLKIASPQDIIPLEGAKNSFAR